MLFTISLYLSLAVFAAGLLFKVSTWFRYHLEKRSQETASTERTAAAAKGIASMVCSAGIVALLKAFFLDVILQYRILREDLLRWLMHMLIYVGFTMLLLMHALEKLITVRLFPEYYATVNPFFFLRDLFGALVFAGLAISVYRRFVLKVPRLTSDAMDRYAIIILAIIMISGFLLEGTKITSYSAYETMVEDYAGIDDGDELAALESVWVRDFSVVSPNIKGPFQEDVIEQGLEIHAESCAECHAKPQWAFGGFLTAKILSPVALALDGVNFSNFLWALHFLACFVGLAYLPFSKMFHIISTPLSILVNSVMDRETSDPANIATRQIMELDACTRCGTCSLNCSVAFSFEQIPNSNILPSIKIKALKTVAKENNLDRQAVKSLQEGLYVCTNCYRCTTVCPSGINLQDLWFTTRESFLEKAVAEPMMLSGLSYHRGLNRDRIETDDYQKPVTDARKAVFNKDNCIDIHGLISDASMDPAFKNSLSKTLPGDTSHYCFACTTCTVSCPVVRNYENPVDALGMMPHQMIRAANFGLGDMIFESTMLWSCLGCYACQENCPQGVKITDVFYELKSLAINTAKEKAVSILS